MIILDIPFLNPIKFVPNTATPGYPHFDSDWFVNQIKSFETKAIYYQKWQIGDSTPIQVESSIIPDDAIIYDCNHVSVKTIQFAKTADGEDLGKSVYEAQINLDTLPVNSVYYIYLRSAYAGIQFEAISEPIKLATLWPDTVYFSCKNSNNDFGVIFTTGVEFNFRCEAGIMDFTPENESTDYVDQIHDIEILSETVYRTFKLYIGDERGVAPWVIDLMNRITACDYWEAENMQYTKNTGAKWEITRVKPYPMVGAAIEIIPSQNVSGLQFFDNGDLVEGMVMAYNIDTNFFGTVEDDIHIIDIEQTD